MVERRYLGEVQGLRAVAALLVAVYHIWLQRVSGGVDVFFVVSAYFMMAALLRREPMGVREMLAQWGSTLRRIVPGAMLVIAATAIGCLVLLPDPLWLQMLPQAWWSLLFAENFLLASSVVDYLTPRVVQTPFQQFWALSLQMQMLLALPVVYLACSVVARWTGRARMVATVAFGTIFAASLAWSIVATRADQTVAYYLPTTRAWEFAAGALAALWLGQVRLAPGVARILGYAGLLVLVSFGLVIDVSRQFPGIVAAVPVLCALAIILAASNGAGMRLLDNRVSRRLGEISFAFYLWHWPLLVFWRFTAQSLDVGLWGGLAIIVAAGLLAYASTALVETPVRQLWRPAIGFAATVLCIGVGAGAVGGWQAVNQVRSSTALAALEAYRAAPEQAQAPGQIVPEPIIARFDEPAIYADKCVQTSGAELVQCDYGDTHAAVTLAVVGGSHMAQWMDVFDAIGRAQGYRVVAMTKNACTFTSDRDVNRTCRLWNESVMAALETLRPDLVVALVTRTSRDAAAPESIPHGYATVLAQLEAQQLRVLGLRDNPRFDFDVLSCVARHRTDPAACGRPRDDKLGDVARMVGDMGPNISFVDVTDALCDAEFCPVVENGVLLYRDSHHLTRTATMQFVEQLGAATASALAPPLSQEDSAYD